MTYRKHFGLWFALSFWTTLLPITIISQIDGYQLWGDKSRLQPNLQRCHPSSTDRCILTHWCETIDLSQGVRSPFTSYSNIVFMLLACLIFTLSYYTSTSDTNHLKHFPYLSYHYAIVLWWAGASSFLCHASGLPLTRELDRSGIWGILLYPVMLAILRIYLPPISQKWYLRFLTLFYLLWSILSLYHLVWGNQNHPERDKIASRFIQDSVPFMVVILILLVYLEKYIRSFIIRYIINNLPIDINPLTFYTMDTSHYLALIAIVLGVIGFLLQNPERIGLQCDPTQLVWYHQTHGYWHITNALAYFTVWWMLWTEKKITL